MSDYREISMYVSLEEEIIALRGQVHVLKTALEDIIRLNEVHSPAYGDSARLKFHACVRTARAALEAAKD
jgi:hypothetical protein